jgi:sulfite exporter TauE/SafE
MKSGIVFGFGFLLVAGGVGGAEQSLDNTDLLKGVAIAIVGLIMMFTALPYLQENNND